MRPTNVGGLPFSRFAPLAEAKRADYAAGDPFPHLVIDDLFPADMLEGVLAEIPASEWSGWKRFNDGTGVKLACQHEEYLGPSTLALLRQLNGSRFLTFLEQLTGIEGLISDPHLEGGGIHQIGRGGFLKIHADFNRHQRLRLDRRLNLLVYLNRDWRDEYGGHLELWTRDMKRCARRVLPVFNRCVVFSTTDFAFHGHPDPLTCPEGWSRKSLALYYYTNGRPASELSRAHSTLYQRRPDEGVYSTRASARTLFHRLLGKAGSDRGGKP